MRRALLALTFGLAVLPAAAVGEPGQQPEIAGLGDPAEPIGEIVLLGETDLRMTVPVAVGGAGPYNFVVDTGAERTVISRELAGTLNLADGPRINVVSMTGRAPVDTKVIPSLRISAVGESGRIEAPAYAGRNLGAPGLLGIDTLGGHAVTVDFERRQMTVARSEKRTSRVRREPGEIVVSAKSLYGQLILTEAYIGETRIRVLLDTGSTATVGNSALMRRVGRSKATMVQTSLTSVTGDRTLAHAAMVPRVKVGGVVFENLRIAFSDVAPFKRLGLDKRPALILGMDALRAFRQLKIDFANREVRFLLPHEHRLARSF